MRPYKNSENKFRYAIDLVVLQSTVIWEEEMDQGFVAQYSVGSDKTTLNTLWSYLILFPIFNKIN